MFHVEHLPSEIVQKLKLYEQTLLKWQKAINLVSRGTLNDIWHRHIEDSIQVFPLISGKKILDVGSGGGFPGMVLAILGSDKDIVKAATGLDCNLDVTCVDSDSRKVLFLEEVARLTKTNVTTLSKRIEDVEGGYDVVTARGFAELKVLLDITMSKAKCGVFLKGANLNKEIDAASEDFDFSYEIIQSSTDKMGQIIVVKDIKRKR
jgi:16S rRNA (guanine527-N7)-methyltransferase